MIYKRICQSECIIKIIIRRSLLKMYVQLSLYHCNVYTGIILVPIKICPKKLF